MKCVHSERNESNRKEARDLTAWMAHHLYHTGRCIIVPVTMIQDTLRILIAIILTVFSYSFKATGTFISHVYSVCHPRKENNV